MKNNDGSRTLRDTVILVAVFAAVPVGATIWAYWTYIGYGLGNITNDMERWGQTGDFFSGVLNPAFGFLTVILLLRTLQQTDRSFKESEEELRLSREEMKRSADALLEQAKDLKQQTFERTFFELLRLYNEIVDGVVDNHVFARPGYLPKTGREALQNYCWQFKQRLHSHIQKNPETEQNEAINQVWLEYYKDRQNQLGHWFRSLYNILNVC